METIKQSESTFGFEWKSGPISETTQESDHRLEAHAPDQVKSAKFAKFIIIFKSCQFSKPTTGPQAISKNVKNAKYA